MQHLETNDVLSVIMDDYKQVTDAGIVLTKDAAIVESEHHRTATVHAAPEHVTIRRSRGEKQIEVRIPCPVKVGDRVLISRYGGVGAIKNDEGQAVTLVRFHEVLGLLEE